MTIKLNIGLRTDGRFCTPYIMAASYAKAVVSLAGFKIVAESRQNSETEPTLCLAVEDNEPFHHASLRVRLHAVANKLHQDCIAVLIGDKGRLIGDRAYKWGEFDASQFLHP